VVRGCIGGSAFIFLECSRIRSLGWKRALIIREGVLRMLRCLFETLWLLERRG